MSVDTTRFLMELVYRWSNQLSIWKIQRATLWRSGCRCWDLALKLRTGLRISCGTMSTQKACTSTRYIYMDKFYSIFIHWFRSLWYDIPKYKCSTIWSGDILIVNHGVNGKMHKAYPCWLTFVVLKIFCVDLLTLQWKMIN